MTAFIFYPDDSNITPSVLVFVHGEGTVHAPITGCIFTEKDGNVHLYNMKPRIPEHQVFEPLNDTLGFVTGYGAFASFTGPTAKQRAEAELARSPTINQHIGNW